MHYTSANFEQLVPEAQTALLEVSCFLQRCMFLMVDKPWLRRTAQDGGSACRRTQLEAEGSNR